MMKLISYPIIFVGLLLAALFTLTKVRSIHEVKLVFTDLLHHMKGDKGCAYPSQRHAP